MDPNDSNIVYLTSDVSGVYKSIDGGDTWKPKCTGLESLDVASVAVDPSNSNNVWASTGLGLYKSEDAGDSWTMNNSSIRNFSLVGLQAISISQDGQTILCVSCLAYDYQNNYLYAGTSGANVWKIAVE